MIRESPPAIPQRVLLENIFTKTYGFIVSVDVRITGISFESPDWADKVSYAASLTILPKMLISADWSFCFLISLAVIASPCFESILNLFVS